MGTGNYSHQDGNTVILDIFDGIEFDEDDPDLASILKGDAFEELQYDIKDILSGTSFDMDGETWRSGRSGELILAENNLFQIWSHEDSYGHVFITYGLNEDLCDSMDGIARHHLCGRSEAFFDKLQKLYSLRVATSPWTSGERTPMSAAA